MMYSHVKRFESPRVDFVVELIDDFTGFRVSREVQVYLEGQIKNPVVNPSGYFVFTGIEGAKHTLHVRCKYFFDVQCPIDLEAISETPPVMTVRLRPKGVYPFPSTATLIRGRIAETLRMNDKLQVNVLSLEGAFAKLIKTIELGEDHIVVTNVNGSVEEGMGFGIFTKEGTFVQNVEIFKRTDEKGVFQLKNNVKHAIEKGSLLLPANEVYLDALGQFTIYFNKMMTKKYTIGVQISGTDSERILWEVDEGKKVSVGTIDENYIHERR